MTNMIQPCSNFRWVQVFIMNARPNESEDEIDLNQISQVLSKVAGIAEGEELDVLYKYPPYFDYIIYVYENIYIYINRYRYI